MAARFDATRAQQLGQNTGDGTPIMLTIPVKEPWVPLHILSLGLDKAAVIDADVFLLTDNQPKLLAGGTGLSGWGMSGVGRPASGRSGADSTRRSLSLSSELVASSRISTAGFLSTARAMAIRCRWPPESLTPRSPTSVS